MGLILLEGFRDNLRLIPCVRNWRSLSIVRINVRSTFKIRLFCFYQDKALSGEYALRQFPLGDTNWSAKLFQSSHLSTRGIIFTRWLVLSFEIFEFKDCLPSLEPCKLVGPGAKPKLQDSIKDILVLDKRLCVDRLVDFGIAKSK